MSANLFSAVVGESTANSMTGVSANETLAKEQYDLFKRAYDNGHVSWLRDATKFDDFYVGNQWDEAVKRQLEAEGRPAVTNNLVLSTINVVLGEQANSRLTINYKHRKDGSADQAFLLTKMAQAILAANQFSWVESQVFADGLIQDRGYFDVRMDWSASINGKPRIRALDPGNVIPDPTAKSWDPETWNEVWYSDLLTLDEIAATYGEEHVDNLNHLVATGTNRYGPDSIQFFGNTFGNDNNIDNLPTEAEKRRIRTVRVIERQFRTLVRVYTLIHPETGQRRELPLAFKQKDAEALAKQCHCHMIPQVVSKIRWRVTADRFVLHDEFSPYKSFTIIPYFPYFRRGKPFGMVRNLVSPQEQLNKLSSQELHVVNSTANSGWIVEHGALYGMTADELATVGSKTGLVIETAPGRRESIKKIEANSIPSGLDRLSSKSAINIQAISGVNGAMLATDGPEVSGVALEKKRQAGAVQVAVPRDSLTRTQWMVGRKLLELMQDFMGYEQIVRYVDDMEPGSPKEQETVANEVQPDGSINGDITLGEYDVVVGSMPNRDTFNEIQFAEALSLRNAGVVIPDYRVVQYSNLQHKDQIAEEIRNLTGLGEKSPEQIQREQRIQELELRAAEAKAAKDEGQAAVAQTQAQLNTVKAQEIPARVHLDAQALEQKDSVDRAGFNVRMQLADKATVKSLQTVQLGANLKARHAVIEKTLTPTKGKNDE
ncbi:MAG: hypothetical protein E6R03_04140 [Hyphomicrobiaceae bacterium]|nr:MAG: hypothetical protein E6R03_04140 [Hyphomicrobiaceae bacterium]